MAKATLDMYRRVFGQGEGEIILEDLVNRYATEPKVTGGIDAILTTYRDAGARSVCEFILSRVEMARQELRPDADQSE